jgi:hypothetical protein
MFPFIMREQIKWNCVNNMASYRSGHSLERYVRYFRNISGLTYSNRLHPTLLHACSPPVIWTSACIVHIVHIGVIIWPISAPLWTSMDLPSQDVFPTIYFAKAASCVILAGVTNLTSESISSFPHFFVGRRAALDLVAEEGSAHDVFQRLRRM